MLVVPFLFYGFGGETLKIIVQSSVQDSRWLAFLLGAAIFFPFHFVARRFFSSAWCYLETLEHELTHLLVGLIFLKIPVGIRVSAHEGGEVRQIGLSTIGEAWVTLAPYFFPTISVAVLIFDFFIRGKTELMIGMLGWSTAFHLVTNWSETSFRQPDLQKAGLVKTILILPIMNLICYGSILAFVADGRKGFSDFWFAGFGFSFNLMQEIIHRLFSIMAKQLF